MFVSLARSLTLLLSDFLVANKKLLIPKERHQLSLEFRFCSSKMRERERNAKKNSTKLREFFIHTRQKKNGHAHTLIPGQLIFQMTLSN